jgi:AcrR family transcriptional regulator
MAISMADPTTKSLVRATALRMFAENGIAATSLRAIAGAAGVSPGLVIHHFGSKNGLRRAVDADVLEQLTAALGGTPADPDASTSEAGDPDVGEPIAGREEPLVRVLRTRPALVQYLARALEEDVDIGRELFHRFFPDARGAAGVQDSEPVHAEEFWSSIQRLALIIGPLLLLRFIDHELGGPLLDPQNLPRWLKANARLLEFGLAT